MEVEMNTANDALVEDHPIAKLMYYLSCVNTCTDLAIPVKLRRYYKYKSLSETEILDIVRTAADLDPDIFMQRTVFIRWQHKQSSVQNQIRDLDDGDLRMLLGSIDASFFVRGKQVTVRKVMTFEARWMDNMYYNPMRAVMRDIRANRTPTVPSDEYMRMSLKRPAMMYDRPMLCCFCDC